MTIKNKLYLLMALFIVSTLGLTAFDSAIIKDVEVGEAELIRLEQINSGMLQLRRNEKDFFSVAHEALVAGLPHPVGCIDNCILF